MNDTIALRPLRNVLLSADFQDGDDRIIIREVDIDKIAASVFAAIDANESLHELRAVIARNFAAAQTDWLTGSGSEEELEHARETFTRQLTISLASAYPIAGGPDVPLVDVTVEPATLSTPPQLAELRQWTCRWQVNANLRAYDIDDSNAGAPPPSRPAATDPTSFELALLWLQRAAIRGDELLPYAEALATAPIEKHESAPYEGDLHGLAELTVTRDVLESLDLWATITRNAGPDVNPAFIHRTVSARHIDAPFVQRTEEVDLPSATGLASATLVEHLRRIETELLRGELSYRLGIFYVANAAVPLLLVIDQFEAETAADVIRQAMELTGVQPTGEAALRFEIEGSQFTATLRLPFSAID